MEDDVHFAQTKASLLFNVLKLFSLLEQLVALENTLNGVIFPHDEVMSISALCKSNGLKLHLDGARIWHVAAETGTALSVLCEPFDSVSLCFSKGLGAPVGSCLVGSKPFIKKAKAFRKLFGGGMRQSGFLAAAAAYSLTKNYPLIPQVHNLAKRLSRGLESIGVKILLPADTCMVFYDPAPVGLEYSDILEAAAKLPDPVFLGGSRLVVHIQTSEQAVEDILSLIAGMAMKRRLAGGSIDHNAESEGITGDNVYVRIRKPH